MRKSLLYGNRLLLVFVFFDSLFGLFLRGTELNLPLAPRLFVYYLELSYA
jgi:hypothetical protein